MIDQVRFGNGETDMDGGSFRTPQPDRRVINRADRAEPAARQPEQPQPVIEEPKPVHRSAAAPRQPKEEKKSSKRWILPVVIVIIVALLAVGAWFAWSNTQSKTTAIDTSKYQAVSISDGQLYFGKLSVLNDGYMKLTDVYYLQPQANDSTSDSSDSTNSNFKLAKFTDAIYGPEGEIIISKDQILFYENLQPDGKVAQLIDEYNKTN